MAVAYDNSTDLGNNGGGTGYTASYTMGSVSQGWLEVGFAGDVTGGADDITGVTYNGVAMTLKAKNTAITAERIGYVYVLANPASGAHNVVISASSAHYIIANAKSYSGVDHDEAAVKGNAGSVPGSLATNDTTIDDNCWWTGWAFGFDTLAAPTAGSGATRRVWDAAFGGVGGFDSNGVIHPAGSTTFNVNYGSSTSIGSIMYALSPLTPAAGQVPYDLQHSPGFQATVAQ